MYVCICNALTDRQIGDAICGGAKRPCEVYTACNSKAQCGGCTRTILSILRQDPQEAKGS
ncbi:(2Fe-2S)-binding protein [Plastoroseomonas hellenica]|uniref:Bacterioferritin-associated ferredoxin n=1 Tax=Plastoroseomonas hellenica TaxID=2687306 RepID=A0ABS5EZQ5_9PROT|nr:(2Fe-2S)-binding protein [Plastoroseomonas hellenica]MBR0643493.1 (2Fe-2S)-binding protein [Plastoroseomonas hellenica]MBR0665784.1 (2Fe-2S)-binding protein [Plastoroseomonas hellenica]